MNKKLYFECLEGYATDENLVVAKGDILRFLEGEEGMLYFEGVEGWCEGTEINFTPKVVAKHFKTTHP
jgi:hypothetical protein